MSDLVRLGEHATNFDGIPDGQLGSFGDPFTLAPDNWDEDGIPYGAWCKCSRCERLGRSTYAFDFYAKSKGELLVCEECNQMRP